MFWGYPPDLFGNPTPTWRLTYFDAEWNWISEAWVQGCVFDFNANSFDPGTLVGLGGYVDGVGNVDKAHWTDAEWREAFLAFGGTWEIVIDPAPLVPPSPGKGKKLGHGK